MLGRFVLMVVSRDERWCMWVEAAAGEASNSIAPSPSASAKIEPPVLLAVKFKPSLKPQVVSFARPVKDPKMQSSEPSRSGGERKCTQQVCLISKMGLTASRLGGGTRQPDEEH